MGGAFIQNYHEGEADDKGELCSDVSHRKRHVMSSVIWHPTERTLFLKLNVFALPTRPKGWQVGIKSQVSEAWAEANLHTLLLIMHRSKMIKNLSLEALRKCVSPGIQT